ncbi:MAG: S8 family serine peptidase [Oribacterium sp.]
MLKYITKKAAARTIAAALLLSQIAAGTQPVTYAAPLLTDSAAVHSADKREGESTASESGNPEKTAEAEKLLSGMTAPYDLLLKFRCEDEGLSRKEKAEKAQAAAIKRIEEAEKQGRVTEWESFYITNAIHLVTEDRELVLQLAALPELILLTENRRVDSIAPVEDDGTKQDSIKKRIQRSTLYQPDERDIEWGVQMVHADKVWEEFGVDGRDAVVGIIDGGANYNLKALRRAFLDYDAASDTILKKQDDPATKVWEGGGYRDFVDRTTVPQLTSSDDHGTHVAGTIVGEEGSNLNRIGVAPGAKFITARAMGPEGGEVDNLIAAAQWMLEMHPDVVNNSWGGEADTDIWFKDVTDAWVEAGIIPVFAAGNTSGKIPGKGTISNPANYENVIAVAAVDRNKKIGRFSNKGPSAFNSGITKPELSAPGVQVRSVNSAGTYVSWNGTSMAAPHVAGVVALLRSAAKKYHKEEMVDTLEEVRALLMETAEPLEDGQYPGSPNDAYGAGLINAYDAVAKLMDRGQASIIGTVYQKGTDAEEPKLSLDVNPEGYIGRDVKVTANASDDVSIRKLMLRYWLNAESGQAKEIRMTLFSGEQKNGVYTAVIPSEELGTGTLHIEAIVTDYANHEVKKETTVTVQKGASLPWSENFERAEEGLRGFLMDGSWAISHRSSNAEPPFPDSGDGSENKSYIGINGGYAGFERRVDSYLYLPPIDLSNVSVDPQDPHTVPSLSVDMYNGFSGISQAKLQASLSGREGDWEDIYQVVLRPDIKDRAWEHNTISLEKYAGKARPLQLRFYFFGHDGDEGVGWYLDNLRVDKGENTAPGQVQDLRGRIEKKGLLLSFVANEETDMKEYRIERRGASEDADAFRTVAEVKQDKDAFQFINKGEDPKRPASHYRVNWYDTEAVSGESYVYRVCAADRSGNIGQYSKELTVHYTAYKETAAYDFEDGEQGFLSGAENAGSSTLNEWEWGVPEIPDTKDMSLLPRTAWEGLRKERTGEVSHVFGTNLSGKIHNDQDSWLLMPAFRVQEGDHLYFDSYSGNDAVSDTAAFTVEIREKGSGQWTQLLSKERVQDHDQIFTWQQLGASLRDYTGTEVEVRFHAVTTKGGWIDNYNLGWYIDNVYVGAANAEFMKQREASDRAGGRLATPSEPEREEGITTSVEPEREEKTASPSELEREEKNETSSELESAERVATSSVIPDSEERKEDAVSSIDSQKRREKDGTARLRSGESFGNGDLPLRAQYALTEEDAGASSGNASGGKPELTNAEDRGAEEAGKYRSDAIPLKAKVSVKETGRYTQSSAVDGSFRIDHAMNRSGSSYTLEVSAYGFRSRIVKNIDLRSGRVLLDDIVLEPAEKASFSGCVTGENGEGLSDVRIRIEAEETLPPVYSGADGGFTIDGIYEGSYTVRFYKEGYATVQKEITLHAGENAIAPVQLKPLGSLLSETVDYHYTEETDASGNYQTIFFTSGVRGMAVRFQSPHKGGILKSADIFTVLNQYFGGHYMEIGVLSYNDTGRLVELADFREYPDALQENGWSTIDFSEYMIQTDKPLYIVATYKDSVPVSESMGVYYDTKASEKAVSHSYVYDGSFTKTESISPKGAYAVKTTWLYTADAATNPEWKEAENGGAHVDPPVNPSDEGEFIFDADSRTITKYSGKSRNVTIPSVIRDTPVEKIGKGAFDGVGKEEKLETVTFPEGLTEIGDGAFKNNNLKNVEIPDTVTKIGASAFAFQYKDGMDDKSFTVTLPEGITEIAESTFEGAGSPLRAKLPGVESIRKGAFRGSSDVEIEAPRLREITDDAFGTYDRTDYNYARIYTDPESPLNGKSGQYLINPAVVTITARNARDHEEILKRAHYYGTDVTTITRNIPAERFYRMGQSIRFEPPVIRKDGTPYFSADPAAELKLQKTNAAEFYYYAYQPHLRLPVLDSDRKLVGFTAPNASVTIRAGAETVTAAANEDGFFEAEVKPMAAGTRVSLEINGKTALTAEVERNTGESDYLIENGVLLRYTGAGGNLRLPVAGNGGSVTEIGDFAFYEASLSSVILPDKVKSIGAGAFMNTGLQSFGWDLRDINRAALVYINEYAFRNDALGEVRLPELTHVIRTAAFENNEIETLELGTYTSHIGDHAFRNNHIRRLETAKRQEELGKGAFENNEISELTVHGWMAGYEEGITELPDYVFAGNQLTEVQLPKEISSVSPLAFLRNPGRGGRFIVGSDNAAVRPTENYDVRRSDGTLLCYQKDDGGKTDPKPDDNGKKNENGGKNNGSGGRRGTGGSGGHSVSPSVRAAAGAGAAGASVQILGSGWTQDAGGWRYQSASGTAAKSCWGVQTDAGRTVWYYFGADGYMQTGWISTGSSRYYLNPVSDGFKGKMLTGWQWIDGYCYYFETEPGKDMGHLYTAGMTPDGYTVDAAGRWTLQGVAVKR